MLYVRETTTVGELKKFLADVPDDTKIFLGAGLGNTVRFDDFKPDCYSDSDVHELYIELV